MSALLCVLVFFKIYGQNQHYQTTVALATGTGVPYQYNYPCVQVNFSTRGIASLILEVLIFKCKLKDYRYNSLSAFFQKISLLEANLCVLTMLHSKWHGRARQHGQ